MRTEAFIKKMMMQATGQSYPAVSDKIVKASEIPLPPLEEQKRIAGILDQADALRRLRARAIDKLNTLGQAIFHEMFVAEEHRFSSVPLGDICRPKQHKTIPAKELLEDGYPVFGANGQIGHYSTYTHEKRTIAITCRGATCGTINIAPEKSYITGNAMALDDLDEDQADLDFLVEALRVQGLNSMISGSAQPQITRAPLLQYTVPLPPLETQQAFASTQTRISRETQSTAKGLAKFGELFASLQHRAFRGEL